MPKTSPESGQPVSRGGRFPLSPRIILALARQTFQYCVRRKVLLVLLIFGIFLWVSYSVAPRSFPEKRVELVIQASLILTSFFGVIVIVFLASTIIPADLNDRTIYTVLTKPVGRLNYLLGRIVGFSLLSAVLLLVMGAVSWGFIRHTAHWASGQLPGQTLLQARRSALPARITLRPSPDAPDMSARTFEDTGKIGLWGDWSNTLVFDFAGSDLRRQKGDDITVTFQPEVLTGAKLPRSQVLVRAVNPVTGFSNAVRTTFDSTRLSTLTFPGAVVDPEQGTELQLQRLTAGIILVTAETVGVALSPAPFEVPFLKSLLMIFCAFVLLSIIGVTASTFLSRWVAVVFSFFAYLVGVFSQVLADIALKLSGTQGHRGLLGTDIGVVIAEGHHHGPGEVIEPNRFIDAVNWTFSSMLRVVTSLIPDFRKFDGGQLLVGGYDIPIGVLGQALGFAAAYGLVYLIVAQLVWHRREVG